MQWSDFDRPAGYHPPTLRYCIQPGTNLRQPTRSVSECYLPFSVYPFALCGVDCAACGIRFPTCFLLASRGAGVVRIISLCRLITRVACPWSRRFDSLPLRCGYSLGGMVTLTPRCAGSLCVGCQSTNYQYNDNFLKVKQTCKTVRF